MDSAIDGWLSVDQLNLRYWIFVYVRELQLVVATAVAVTATASNTMNDLHGYLWLFRSIRFDRFQMNWDPSILLSKCPNHTHTHTLYYPSSRRNICVFQLVRIYVYTKSKVMIMRPFNSSEWLVFCVPLLCSFRLFISFSIFFLSHRFLRSPSGYLCCF